MASPLDPNNPLLKEENIDKKEDPVKYKEFDTVNATNFSDYTNGTEEDTQDTNSTKVDNSTDSQYIDVDKLSIDHIRKRVKGEARNIVLKKQKEMEKSVNLKGDKKTNEKIKDKVDNSKINNEKLRLKSSATSTTAKKESNPNEPHIDVKSSFLADLIKKLVNQKMQEKQKQNNNNKINNNDNNHNENNHNENSNKNDNKNESNNNDNKNESNN